MSLTWPQPLVSSAGVDTEQVMNKPKRSSLEVNAFLCFYSFANLIYLLTSSTWKFSSNKYGKSKFLNVDLSLSDLKGMMHFHQ